MDLKIEHSKRILVDKNIRVGNTIAMVTPALDEDFWLLRVSVGEKQAIVLFPKFSMYGIGFQHEEDWNTNLPSGVPAEDIYRHIRHNKQDKRIPKARCIKAIRMLQQEIVRLTGEDRHKPKVENGVEVRPF